jgi:hypothetical protein
VEHDDDAVVAVCGNSPPECDPKVLERWTIRIHEVNVGNLLFQVSKALDLRPEPRLPGAQAPGIWPIGIHRAEQGAELPVYLSIQFRAEALHRAAADLLARADPFILMAPTLRWDDTQLHEVFRHRKSWFLALEDLLAVEGQARLIATRTIDEVLAARRTPVAPAENLLEKLPGGWRIRFAGSEKTFLRQVGIGYLRVLLQHPGDTFSPEQLANLSGDLRLPALAPGEGRRSRVSLEEDSLHATRARSLGKVRKRVSRNLRNSLKKIERELPELEAHLKEALIAGPLWSYRRESAVEWQFLP